MIVLSHIFVKSRGKGCHLCIFYSTLIYGLRGPHLLVYGGWCPGAALEDVQGLVLAGEAGQGDLDDPDPLAAVLAGHELVHGGVAEAGIAVAVLGADDGEGVAGVGGEQVAREAAGAAAGDAAPDDGVHEEQDGVPRARARVAEVGGAVGDGGVAHPGRAPARLRAVDGGHERRGIGGLGFGFGLGWCVGRVVGVVVAEQARPVPVAGAHVDDLAACG